jgi:nucleoside-diphosphate-sugar epimerase
LEDESLLRTFLHQGTFLFHCAAEMNDHSKMWAVNVHGTERLFHLASEARINYFCYMSSAGVIGRTSCPSVTERASCNPQNVYEQSKWAAEQIVAQGLSGGRVVILRPTNVVDIHKPGAIEMPMRRRWQDRLKVFLKGGECAHIVHAEDVARAALYLNLYPIDTPECFFVSCDDDPLNTFGGIWALFMAIQEGRPIERIQPVRHLPVFVPQTLRGLWRGSWQYGSVRYSSGKLLSTGFRYSLGVEGAVRSVARGGAV